MSYFSAAKNDRDIRVAKVPEVLDSAKPAVRGRDVSLIGAGMQVTGNIVCAGALQVNGQVTGDIHAAYLTISEGARVEGNLTATEAVIEGTFKGTIHGNSVKLQKSAVVEGEIYNKSLSIEQEARFEGVSRRLERAVEAPGTTPSVEATLAPIGGVA